MTVITKDFMGRIQNERKHEVIMLIKAAEYNLLLTIIKRHE